MKKYLFTFILLTSVILPQGSAGDKAIFEYRSLVDMPVAGVIKKGHIGTLTNIMPNGVVIIKAEVGLMDNFSVGLSYGGENIVGAGDPTWYKYPGLAIRYKIFSESLIAPAFTIGFDSQGKGLYFDSTKRYAIKSPGLFAAISKNYAILGFLSIHGTVNYSFEKNDGDSFINLMIGAEKTLGHYVSFIAEYDFAWNDNRTRNFGDGNGYLNMGIRWSLSDGFTVEFDLRDMLDNKKWAPSTADRAIKLEYVQKLFD